MRWHGLEKGYMHRIIVSLSMITGLIVSATGIASASPATHLLAHSTVGAATSVERIDYYWNHHHYQHRSWDKQHARWHYYN
jgi:hypothetical protein